MSFTRCTLAAALVLSLPLHAETAAAPAAAHVIVPQIVRLSLAEGDVRIALPKHDAKLTGASWEQAVSDIPLASGFSLATGPDGRAEIEFEDASTVYLAPNSALILADLTTRDNVPHTQLELLSGTLTLHLAPDIPGERFLLRTATHFISIAYPDVNYSRVTSYLDGLQITPIESTHLSFRNAVHALPSGATYNFYAHAIFPTPVTPTPATIAFDAWVAARLRARDAAMASVMHDAGLTTPLPGLADLAGQGAFTSCAPYGTCWEPTHGWIRPAALQSGAAPVQPPPDAQAVPSGSAATAPALYAGDFDDFPCDPTGLWYLRRRQLLDPSTFYYPYDWTVCHTGFWIFRNRRYLWVMGTHKHHRCPVRWVKYQGKLGYVPLHPRDKRGVPPVNLRHGLYTLTGRPDHPVDRLALDTRSSPKVLDTTPKDFRNPAPPLLARASAPEIAVHFMRASSPTGAAARLNTATLGFNNRSHQFELATRTTDSAGRIHTFTTPMSDRGGHIATASGAGFSHGGDAAAGRSGGGYAGGGGGHFGGGGGGYSGGGGHFGGGGGGYSGGGHAGGGGGGGGTGSSSAGGGGGHH